MKLKSKVTLMMDQLGHALNNQTLVKLCCKYSCLEVSHLALQETMNSLAITGQLKLTETQISYAMTGLVSGAVTGVTNPWGKQLVDIVGAAFLYLNEDPVITTVSKPTDADFSTNCTLGHCRMIFTQPGREACITFVHRYGTCGNHFCACSSLEAIPAIKCVVTFGVYCYVVIFSCSICQRYVVLTYVNYKNKQINTDVNNSPLIRRHLFSVM